MTNIIDFPKLPLWYEDMRINGFTEVIVDETNLESWIDYMEFRKESSPEYEFGFSQDDVRNSVREFNYVIMCLSP